MALKLPAADAANVAIQSIGCGYDISLDLRLTYCKRGSSSDVVGGNHNQNRLIEVDEAEGRDIVLPCGLLIPDVARSIRCDKGERTRFRSDVLSFQQVYKILLTPFHKHLLLNLNPMFAVATKFT